MILIIDWPNIYFFTELLLVTDHRNRTLSTGEGACLLVATNHGFDKATAMAVMATVTSTETKMAVSTTEGTMAGCNDQNRSNRAKGRKNNDGNKVAIGRHRGGCHALLDLVGDWWWTAWVGLFDCVCIVASIYLSTVEGVDHGSYKRYNQKEILG